MVIIVAVSTVMIHCCYDQVVGLRLLDDGTYVPDFTPDFIAEQGRGFVKYSQGIFTLEQVRVNLICDRGIYLPFSGISEILLNHCTG